MSKSWHGPTDGIHCLCCLVPGTWKLGFSEVSEPADNHSISYHTAFYITYHTHSTFPRWCNKVFQHIHCCTENKLSRFTWLTLLETGTETVKETIGFTAINAFRHTIYDVDLNKSLVLTRYLTCLASHLSTSIAFYYNNIIPSRG